MKLVKLHSILLTIVVTFCASVAVADSAAGVLNANSATAEELAGLPHMDDILAAAVVDNRPYATILDLDDLLSADLEDDQLEELYVKLFVPIKLNTAGRDAIMLIPGMSERMAHEFEEYRPYSNIEQFRREIGKYVDEAEVARLEQYVTLE